MSISQKDYDKTIKLLIRVARKSGPAASVSYGLVGSVLLGILSGWFLDIKSGFLPLFTLLGVTIGMIVGFYLLYREIYLKKK